LAYHPIPQPYTKKFLQDAERTTGVPTETILAQMIKNERDLEEVFSQEYQQALDLTGTQRIEEL
jgi:hypothetical protein